MGLENIIFGLVDDAQAIGGRQLAKRWRDLTISWSRFCFHGSILEGETVDQILDQALDRTLDRACKYCFIQWAGHLISPNELPVDGASADFASALGRWLEATDFLISGYLIGDQSSWFGFAKRCLVVDLDQYRGIGRPRFESAIESSLELPQPDVESGDGSIRSLAPSGRRCSAVPRHPGWTLIRAALDNGFSVPELGPEVRGHTLSLVPDESTDLSPEQARFHRSIRLQTANSRKAVGLWNIEPYSDIEPPAGFDGPLTALYSVAQGFKPNMILARLGFGDRTRVVFFDYSPQALAVRKRIVERWDGEDFPRFIRYLFQTFPHPETYYYLWRGLRPDQIDWDDMDRLWQRELNAWGGAAALREHWHDYRELPHEYVHCDLLTDTSDLLTTIEGQGAAAVWWSNAFFTIYSNWNLDLDQRRQRYQDWIAALARRHPELCLFGSDYVNNSVNDARAGTYCQQFRALDRGGLEPVKLHRRQISM